MRAIALLVSFALLPAAGCFPNNARHRTYAKIGEGAALATGIGILLFSRTGADCSPTPGTPYTECRTEASAVSAVGLGLILAGLVGFIATVSTAPDDKPALPAAPSQAPAPPAPAPPAPPTPLAAPPAPATQPAS
ncbi:MAG TPA: hypothetical protein VN253_16005 [Kofleriaceae bacterium]|nr:hypothetical protein [Kofleriaceae bacterium]